MDSFPKKRSFLESENVQLAMAIVLWLGRSLISLWFFLSGINSVYPIPHILEITVGIWSFVGVVVAIKMTHKWWTRFKAKRHDNGL